MSDRPLKLFSGNANRPLAEAVSNHLDLPLGDLTVGRHADGEVFVKFNESIRDADVFLIQPFDPRNAIYIIETLGIIDAAVRSSALRICLVLSYYGYARSDRKDQPRVPIMAEVIARIVQSVGLDRIILLDPHTLQVQGYFNKPCRSDTLLARYTLIPELKRHFPDAKQNRSELTFVAPDVGAMPLAKAYASRMGGSIAVISKDRPRSGEIERMTLVGNVRGRTAIMVDDIIDSAKTLTKAAQLLHDHRAKGVMAAAAHGVFSKGSIERIEASTVERVLVTDTLERTPERSSPKIVTVSVAQLLGRAIRATHDGTSVTSLLE